MSSHQHPDFPNYSPSYSPKLLDTHGNTSHHSQESFISTNSLHSSQEILLGQLASNQFLELFNFLPLHHSSGSVNRLQNISHSLIHDFNFNSQTFNFQSQNPVTSPTLPPPKYISSPPSRSKPPPKLKPLIISPQTAPNTSQKHVIRSSSSILKPINRPILQDIDQSHSSFETSSSSLSKNVPDVGSFDFASSKHYSKSASAVSSNKDLKMSSPNLALLPTSSLTKNQKQPNIEHPTIVQQQPNIELPTIHQQHPNIELPIINQQQPNIVLPITDQQQPNIEVEQPDLVVPATKSDNSPQLSQTSQYSQDEHSYLQASPGKPSVASNYSSDTPLLELIRESVYNPLSTGTYSSPFSSRSSSPVKDDTNSFGTAKIYKPVYHNKGNEDNTASSRNPAKKVEINPFEVLYESSNNQSSRSSPPKSPPYTNKSYQQIEREIQKGKMEKSQIRERGHRRIISQSAPVITIIDDSELNRSGSIISREASLRYRGKIQLRNKMVNKADVEQHSQDSKSRSKRFRSFLFPILRKRSLKYSRINYENANFKNNKQLEAYLKESNYVNLVRKAFPNMMDFYSASKLYYVNPHLHKVTKSIDLIDGFSRPRPATKKLQISSPVLGTATKNGEPMEGTKGLRLYDMAYNQFRQEVYSKKYRHVPTFELLFPNDTNLLTKKEIANLNKTFLLEILFRRTVSAKIEFRLRQNGIIVSSSSNQDSGATSSSYSRSGDNSLSKMDQFGIPPPLAKDSGSDEDREDELESINTDFLLQQNASLFSGLLPSPQISYSSDMFGLEMSKDRTPSSIYSAVSKESKNMPQAEDSTKVPYQHHHVKDKESPKVKKLQKSNSAKKRSHSLQKRDVVGVPSSSVGKASRDSSKFRSMPGVEDNSIKKLPSRELKMKELSNRKSNTDRTNQVLEREYQARDKFVKSLQQDKSIDRFGKHKKSIVQTKHEVDLNSMQGSLSIAASSTFYASST